MPNKSDTGMFIVIRQLCKNPDGLFWAGDTAQTISVGSSFRFDDLKAFCYRLEVRIILARRRPSDTSRRKHKDLLPNSLKNSSSPPIIDLMVELLDVLILLCS